MTLRWPLTLHVLMSHVQLYLRIIVSNSHGNTSKYVDTMTIFFKLNQNVNDPKMTFDLTSVEVTCVTVPKDHCIQVPWKYIKVCGYSDPFSKKRKKLERSLTPRWPSTPSLMGSHVWLCPRIIVSKCHEKTSKYVDTVTFSFKNLNQRSLISRWPLTPHLLRPYVWLYPRVIVSKSHGNTSMYVDRVIKFAKYHILRLEWVIT